MPEPQVAPYGSWKSPITTDLIVSATIGLAEPVLEDQDTYWIEARPTEGGRQVLVRQTVDGQRADLTPSPFDVRTRVHEYGGGTYMIRDGTLFFVNFADQRVYRLEPGEEARPITPAESLRYADFVWDKPHGRLICVREDHRGEGEAVNTLVSLEAGGDEEGGRVLVEGNDFYSSPRLSPDGRQLAYLTWNHPNMPWDGTELWLAEVKADGSRGRQQLVAGGPEESIFQPEWSPDGGLHFVSERTGWWNLYRWRDGHIEALYPMAAEFGRPQWVFRMSAYGFLADGRIVCAYNSQGLAYLAVLDPGSGHSQPIETPYTTIGTLRVAGQRVLLTGGAATLPTAVVSLDIGTGAAIVLRASSDITIDPEYFSEPEPIEFPTENGLMAHALYYAPRNQDFAGPAGERPPLLVFSHGGPTGATTAAFNLGIQYWTSRGVAVVDVNYGGSAGYGRAYRQRLNGQWGIVDVDDCVNAARYLAERGDVDGGRLAIRGGSAGGYTTLAAVTFRDVFKAGASYFGISDLEAMVQDTHKFESRYLDNLIGPYPERRDLYIERSPIHFANQINCPMILLQGLEDKVVPPNQAEMMFKALLHKELPVAYLAFEGEQHGFRKAETIKRALDAELYFYSRIFDFELADPVEPVEIENL